MDQSQSLSRKDVRKKGSVYTGILGKRSKRKSSRTHGDGGKSRSMNKDRRRANTSTSKHENTRTGVVGPWVVTVEPKTLLLRGYAVRQ